MSDRKTYKINVRFPVSVLILRETIYSGEYFEGESDTSDGISIGSVEFSLLTSIIPPVYLNFFSSSSLMGTRLPFEITCFGNYYKNSCLLIGAAFFYYNSLKILNFGSLLSLSIDGV